MYLHQWFDLCVKDAVRIELKTVTTEELKEIAN